MRDLQQAIRDKARELLASGQVRLVLGYEAGSVPFRTAPAFIEAPVDVERLVWNPFCTNNLAVYVPTAAAAGRVAVVAKGCDARSIVTLFQEHQVPRVNAHVACIWDAALELTVQHHELRFDTVQCRDGGECV